MLASEGLGGQRLSRVAVAPDLDQHPGLEQQQPDQIAPWWGHGLRSAVMCTVPSWREQVAKGETERGHDGRYLAPGPAMQEHTAVVSNGHRERRVAVAMDMKRAGAAGQKLARADLAHPL